jgi:Uma2 family endonuclease
MERAPLPDSPAVPPVVYPDSDGQPMAENTEQYELIVLLKENLDALFPDAFVAADLFWYPVEGHPEIRLAPDTLVALGRPKGPRSSYRTWEEGGIAPHVVFEIWSPSNTFGEQVKKLQFYERYGVSEFYVFDPERSQLSAWVRSGGSLEVVSTAEGFTSPALRIRMSTRGRTLDVIGPDGQRFLSPAELRTRAEAAQAQAEAAQAQAEAAQAQAEAAQAQAEAAQAQAEALRRERDALLAKLEAAGLA